MRTQGHMTMSSETLFTYYILAIFQKYTIKIIRDISKYVFFNI